jgi:hypothetical protein
MAMAISTVNAHVAVAQNVPLSVYLRNDARVPADTHEAAKAVVSRIYLNVGLDVRWSDDTAPLTVILRPRGATEMVRRGEDALGYTPGGQAERGKLAFILMDRVTAIARGYDAPTFVVLGAAIAHELGHMLLTKEHSAAGVMKAYLNQTDFRKAGNGQLTFTEDQSQRLRARLLIPNPEDS